MNLSSNNQSFEACSVDGGSLSEKNSTYFNYRVISENYFHADLGTYHTYGIAVEQKHSTITLHDISTCQKTVAMMAELFHRLQLSHIHLKDVVEDMLTLSASAAAIE